MDLQLDDNALWKKRMREPKISRFSIARNNPSVGLVSTNIDGKMKTYLWDPQSGKIDDKPCLDDDYYGVFTPDGKYLHYFKDTKGNQHGHRWRMNLDTGEHEDLTPDLPDYYAFRTAFSDDASKFVFLANLGNTTSIYLLSFGNDGKLENRKTIIESTESIMMLRISPDGKLIAFSSTQDGKIDSNYIFVLDANTGNVIKSFCAGKGTSSYVRLFVPNTSKLIIAIDNGSVENNHVWDYQTNELEEISFDGQGLIDVRDISTDGSKVLIDYEFRAKQQLCIYDLNLKTSIKLDQIEGVSYLIQIAGDEIFILNSCSRYKSRILALDTDTGAFKRIALELPESIEASKAEEVHFTGALGDQVYGWLKKPEGKGPFPTIIEVPGGPFSFAFDWYEPDVYLEHGFARLFFSYHGCSTFGEDFLKIIIGRIGELELEDMVAGRKWLVEEGIAIPDKIFLMGGSYGGYLTLFGMVKRPDLWRGGLARTPVADWVSDWEDTNGDLKKCNQFLFNCRPDQNLGLWAKSSPITYVENLNAPLQIISGKNDTRCPRRQNEAFIAKARSLGKDIEEYWYDEGHSSSSVDEQIHQVELRLKFLKRVMES